MFIGNSGHIFSMCVKYVFVLVLALVLSACGGGGSEKIEIPSLSLPDPNPYEDIDIEIPSAVTDAITDAIVDSYYEEGAEDPYRAYAECESDEDVRRQFDIEVRLAELQNMFRDEREGLVSINAEELALLTDEYDRLMKELEERINSRHAAEYIARHYSSLNCNLTCPEGYHLNMGLPLEMNDYPGGGICERGEWF